MFQRASYPAGTAMFRSRGKNELVDIRAIAGGNERANCIPLGTPAGHMSAPPRRQFLRFSLRTLPFGLTLFGAWLGWELHCLQVRQRSLDWLAAQKPNVVVKFSDEEISVWHCPLARAVQSGGADVLHRIDRVHLERLWQSQLRESLEHVQRLGAIRSLVIRDCDLSERNNLALAKCTRVEELYLTGHGAGDETLRSIGALSRLESLALDRTDITDAGIKHLRTLVRLSDLSLCDTAVSDRGLEEIVALRNLQNLDLQGSKITSAGISSLTSLPKLAQLNVSRTRIDEAGARAALRIPTLEGLGISSTQVTLPYELELEFPKVFFY